MSSGAASTGHVFTFSQAGASSGETNVPPANAQERMGRDQRMLERLGASAAGERRPVLDRQRRAAELRLHHLDVERDPAPQRRQLELADADAPLDRLVTLAARLEEPHLDLELGILAADEALQPEVVEAVLVAGRIDDPERRRGRVLVRSGRVRVERVALVEQRVDELLDHVSTFLEQLRHGGVERREAALGLAQLQPPEGVVLQADPAAAAGSGGRSSAATSPPAAGTRPRLHGTSTTCIRPSSPR